MGFINISIIIKIVSIDHSDAILSKIACLEQILI